MSPTPPTPKVFLVRRSPWKLTKYERIGIESLFVGTEPELVRIEMTDWKSHWDFCKQNVNRKRDVVFLPHTADSEALLATALWAVSDGFVHVFFGEDLELRKLTGVKIKSERMKRRR